MEPGGGFAGAGGGADAAACEGSVGRRGGLPPPLAEFERMEGGAWPARPSLNNIWATLAAELRSPTRGCFGEDMADFAGVTGLRVAVSTRRFLSVFGNRSGESSSTSNTDASEGDSDIWAAAIVKWEHMHTLGAAVLLLLFVRGGQASF